MHRDRKSVTAAAVLFTCRMLAITLAARETNRSAAAGNGDREVSDWPSYAHTHDSKRYSSLRQVDRTNVSRLHSVCELRLSEEGPFQTGPIVVGDTMFLMTAYTTAARNATTCRVMGVTWAQPVNRIPSR